MADFALWAAACEGAFCAPGTFMAAYERNRSEAADSVAEADLVTTAMLSFTEKEPNWSGTAGELLTELDQEVSVSQLKSKEWPTTARGLAGQLRRAMPLLRRKGVEISFSRGGREGQRTITVTRGANGDEEPSGPSSPSSAQTLSRRRNDGADGADGHRPKNDIARISPKSRGPFIYKPDMRARTRLYNEAKAFWDRKGRKNRETGE
jgi:hypothetical protein